MAKPTKRGGSIGGIRDPGPMRVEPYAAGPDGSRDGGAMGPIEIGMERDVEPVEPAQPIEPDKLDLPGPFQVE